MDFVVGLDFGSTNSCISYYNRHTKQVVVIQNEQGSYTTPSVLYLSQDSTEILCGEPALHLLNNSTFLPNIFSNLKRLIGQDIKHKVKFNNIEKEFDTKSLVVLYFDYFRKLIMNYFSMKQLDVTAVVITVPAYFNDLQRSVIKDCCECVKFNVLRIINEPTAASLAYAFEQNKLQSCEGEYILTFDSGGGTTDISLLHLDYVESMYEVKNTVGDNFLGGEDITQNVMEYIIKKLSFKNISDKQLNKIRREAESAKKGLSYNVSHCMYLEFGDKDYSLIITQNQFNEINKEFFDKIKNLIYYLLDDYIAKTGDFKYYLIRSIVFVGGTSRIPYFKKLFSDIFPEAFINNTIDPDQTISIGASIQGGLIKNIISIEDGGDTLLMDIIPLSIGIETLGGIMAPIISRNNLIPVSRTKTFSNSVGYDDTIVINIYQGERRFVSDNIHLGSFELKCELFAKYDKGEIIITVTFDISSDSIISATATATINDELIQSQIEITKQQNFLKDDLQEILMYSESNKLLDLEKSNQVLAKIELYDSFKSLLSVFHSNYQDDITLKANLNALFNDVFYAIENYTNYTSSQLVTVKEKFEKQWHMLLFGGPVVLKDEDGLIIDFGGTTLE